MAPTQFPVIDPVATGANILRLRREQGFTVRDLQRYFGFEEPQAIYKWQRGQSLPSVDNLYALSALLDVPMNEILVPSYIVSFERQAEACRSGHFWGCRIHLSAAFGKHQKAYLRNPVPLLQFGQRLAIIRTRGQRYDVVGQWEAAFLDFWDPHVCPISIYRIYAFLSVKNKSM